MFALSAAFDAVVACAVVAWAARARPPLWQLVAALALAVALLAAKGIVMVATVVDVPFGVMHVVWLDLVVVVPLAAGLLGLLAWRSGGWALRGAVVAGLLLAPVGAYASFVEPGRLVVERAEARLDPARAGEDPIRIGVLADLQFERLGEHERQAIELLMAQRPDVILLPGDYHQGSPESFAESLPELRRLLSRLRAPGGVFAVQGDVEGLKKARAVFAETGIRLLVDEWARARVGDRAVLVGGVRLAYWTAGARAFVTAFDARPGTHDVRLLLAHRPDVALGLPPDPRVDLLVAGHTHGGQLQLPFVGALHTASGVPREVGAGGLHKLDGRRLYVSRGVGVERRQAPRLRLGAPPEVSVVTLR